MKFACNKILTIILIEVKECICCSIEESLETPKMSFANPGRWARLRSMLKKTNTRSVLSPLFYTQSVNTVRREEIEFDFKAYMLQKVNTVNRALDAAIELREPKKLH